MDDIYSPDFNPFGVIKGLNIHRRRYEHTKSLNDRLKLRQNDAYVNVLKYDNDVVIKVSRPASRSKRVSNSSRGKINSFSAQTEKSLRFALRNTSHAWKVFCDLTYPAEFPYNVADSKVHLNAFCQFLRRKKIKYFWCMEFQQRGAPHYHFLLDGRIDKDLLSFKWWSICGKLDEKHLYSGTRIGRLRSQCGAISYMSDYLKKLSQKSVPEGVFNIGRFWGMSRGVLICESGYMITDDKRVETLLKPLIETTQQEFLDLSYKSWNNPILLEFNGYGFVGYFQSKWFRDILDIFCFLQTPEYFASGQGEVSQDDFPSEFSKNA